MKLPLEDEHGFLGPEEAAFHAMYVQGGFSTPKREAARMLLDGGTGADRARAWMADKGLSLDDLEWDPGKRIRSPSTATAKANDRTISCPVYFKGPRDQETHDEHVQGNARGRGRRASC